MSRPKPNPATGDPTRKAAAGEVPAGEAPAREVPARAGADAAGAEIGDAIHVLASGRVQGVGFRHFVRKTGDALGCAGWVRNLPDGRVEAVFAGPAEAAQALLDAISRGPDGARVDGVVTRVALDDERERMRHPFALRRDA